MYVFALRVGCERQRRAPEHLQGEGPAHRQCGVSVVCIAILIAPLCQVLSFPLTCGSCSYMYPYMDILQYKLCLAECALVCAHKVATCGLVKRKRTNWSELDKKNV